MDESHELGTCPRPFAWRGKWSPSCQDTRDTAPVVEKARDMLAEASRRIDAARVVEG